MIKINELRIGCLIDTPRGVCQIIGLGSKDGESYARFANIHEGYYLSSCDCIPLTEELLLKCGFEKKDNGYKTEFAEWLEKEFPVIGVLCQSDNKEYLFDVNTDTLRLQYLHQLQNLYFMLTGQELEIKL